MALIKYDTQFFFHTCCQTRASVRSAGRVTRVYDTGAGVPEATSGVLIYESSPPLTQPITPACKGTGFYSALGFLAEARDIFCFKRVLRGFLQSASARWCGWAYACTLPVLLGVQRAGAPLKNSASSSAWCLPTPFNVRA